MPSLNVTINTDQGADEQLLTKKAVNKLLDNKREDPSTLTQEEADADACEAMCNVIKATAKEIELDGAKASATITDL